jgi:hypothetical protein
MTKNAHDELVLLSHIIHKLLGINTSVRQKQASVEIMEAASSIRSPWLSLARYF